MDDPRWDAGCICTAPETAVHEWNDLGGKHCRHCGVQWGDRHYDKDGICVMCGAGDTVCSVCGKAALCWGMECPDCRARTRRGPQ